MRPARFRAWRYALPLSTPLPAGAATLRSREGVIIEIADQHGTAGFGEIAPLPGFSRETLDDAIAALPTVRRLMLATPLPESVHHLNGACETWLSPLGLPPSVRFGVESAALGLIATSRHTSIRSLINARSARSVLVNALLDGRVESVVEQARQVAAQDYRAAKLKISGVPMTEVAPLVRGVRTALGPEVTLRLDANRALTLDQARTLLPQLVPMHVSYVEEPVSSHEDLMQLLRRESSVPLALDETLLDMQPSELEEWRGIRAVILKPTLLGLERATAFAREARRIGAEPVVSSSFESGVGVSILAQFAAALGADDTLAGLGTLRFLERDVLFPSVAIEHGRIDTDSLPDIAIALDLSRLTEVPLD